MSEKPTSLAEQDATVARVAETSMRMMGGAVAPATLRKVQELARTSPDAYPWQGVSELVLADPVDPSELVNRAIVSQRDWVQRGGRAAGGAAARPRRSVTNAGKRLLAILIVRGGFYAIFAAIFVVALVLVQRRWGFDIYEAGRAVEAFVKGLFG